MSVDEIKRILNSLKELPSMPSVVVKALMLIKDPTSGAKDLSKIVANDHAITIALLKIVNSPYFGLSQEIQTVYQAVTLLGFNEVKDVILTAAMKPMMSTPAGKGIWEHGLNTAIAAEIIAKRLGRADYDECFAQGLMHDLGKMVFELYNGMKMREATILARSNANCLMAEKMIFGFDHTEVGYYLANRWGLPKQIVSIMKNHHNPRQSEYKSVAKIVYLADRLVQDPIKDPIIEPEIAPLIDFEISNIEAFRRQVFQQAKDLLRILNTI